MLDLPLSHVPLLFLDTETTGLTPRFGDRVVEIALARFRGEVMENFYTTLLNPERYISPGASRIHGITNADVADAPRFREVVEAVRTEFEGVIVVAHNAPFDLGFMSNEFQLARYSAPGNLCLDTLTLLRRHFRFRSNALQRVADDLQIDRTGSHRALADVLTTREIFQYILDELRPATLRQLLQMQGGTIVWEGTPGSDVPLPPTLEEALRSSRKLFLRYVDERGTRTDRWVSPIRVTAHNEYVLLRAFCHLREQERTFRLDRVVEMKIEGE